VWDKGFSCDNPLCSRFALASRRVGGPCVVTLACTGPPFGPQMIRESNVAASSCGAEWLAGTRHVNQCLGVCLRGLCLGVVGSSSS